MLGLLVLIGLVRFLFNRPRSMRDAVKKFFMIDLLIVACITCYAAMDIDDELQ